MCKEVVGFLGRIRCLEQFTNKLSCFAYEYWLKIA